MAPMIAIYAEGEPTRLSDLDAFIQANEFTTSELLHILEQFAGSKPVRFEGGAAPLVIAKLYKCGDEKMSFEEALELND